MRDEPPWNGMLLELTHTTDLTYSDLISESVMELRVTPRQELDQHRLSFDLSIGPPTSATSYFDWQGNTVHSFAINRFHNQIQIVATSVVETDRPHLNLAGLPDVWPLPSDWGYEFFDYTQFDGPIVPDPRLAAIVSSLHPANGMRLGELVHRLLNALPTQFEYRKGVTTAASPITDILDKGGGVCQDFTHLAIAVLRSLGVPSRYVSGLAHSDTDHHLRGASQTHAWAEAWFPQTGWVGIDPTNNCVVDENFVKVAIGRHFGDVSPNRGVYKGKASESIDVKVTSRRLPTIPPELAAERLGAIDIPAFPVGSAQQFEFARAALAHQQQQQQQGAHAVVYQQQQQQQQQCRHR